MATSLVSIRWMAQSKRKKRAQATARKKHQSQRERTRIAKNAVVAPTVGSTRKGAAARDAERFAQSSDVGPDRDRDSDRDSDLDGGLDDDTDDDIRGLSLGVSPVRRGWANAVIAVVVVSVLVGLAVVLLRI